MCAHDTSELSNNYGPTKGKIFVFELFLISVNSDLYLSFQEEEEEEEDIDHLVKLHRQKLARSSMRSGSSMVSSVSSVAVDMLEYQERWKYFPRAESGCGGVLVILSR